MFALETMCQLFFDQKLEDIKLFDILYRRFGRLYKIDFDLI